MRLYDSLTRAVEEVVPAEDRHVTMYTCGPTVYRYAHLGNLRTFMLGDLIRRALEFEGLRVTQVMNITDVGHMTDESSPEAVDKMLLAMEDEGLVPARDRREVHRRRASTTRPRSGSGRPTATRRRPSTSSRCCELTRDADRAGPRLRGGQRLRLLRRPTFPGYGKLSGNTLDKLREGHRDLETDPRKRHAADFALWKAAGPGRLMKWPTPVGRGVPRLAHRVLGDVDEVPRRAVRHPHRRHRPAVPAPRGRDRAVRGGGRAPVVVDLGPRRAPPPVRAEDREVHRQRRARPRPASSAASTRSRSAGCASRRSTAREMDFSWEAMETADQRVKQLRRHMAEWAPARRRRSARRRRAFDARFREALANDLHLPGAVAIVNELDRDATCRRARSTPCWPRGIACWGWTSSARRRGRLGARRRRCAP